MAVAAGLLIVMVALLVIGFFLSEDSSFASKEVGKYRKTEEADTISLPITQGSEIPGKKIVKFIGSIHASQILVVSSVDDTESKDVDKTITIAKKKLAQKAEKLGANAIINFKIETTSNRSLKYFSFKDHEIAVIVSGDAVYVE